MKIIISEALAAEDYVRKYKRENSLRMLASVKEDIQKALTMVSSSLDSNTPDWFTEMFPDRSWHQHDSRMNLILGAAQPYLGAAIRGIESIEGELA